MPTVEAKLYYVIILRELLQFLVEALLEAETGSQLARMCINADMLQLLRFAA